MYRFRFDKWHFTSPVGMEERRGTGTGCCCWWRDYKAATATIECGDGGLHGIRISRINSIRRRSMLYSLVRVLPLKTPLNYYQVQLNPLRSRRRRRRIMMKSRRNLLRGHKTLKRQHLRHLSPGCEVGGPQIILHCWWQWKGCRWWWVEEGQVSNLY